MSVPQLSIIICTRNRTRLLRQAIDGLLNDSFDKNLYEVLVVDANSTDSTPEMVRELSTKFPNVFYHNCPERGLPKARVYGAVRARASVIGYLDDDAKPCANWLGRASDIAQRLNPICFGGPFFAFYETPKPVWFRDEYGSVTHGKEARYLTADEFVCGGNIFFRRDALAAAGGFDPNFSAAEDQFAYGEEAVPQLRLRRKFPTDAFYYDPELFILHLVRPERMNVWRGVREAFEAGRGYGKLSLAGRTETRRLPFAWRLVYQGTQFAAKSLFLTPFRDRRAFPYWENFVYENAAKEMRSAGVFYQYYLSAKSSQNGNGGPK
jgi:glycosyltransferase involved in cell wall biosynthesis